MPEDLPKLCPEDTSRINLHEPCEVNFWTHHFGVTKAELEAAVHAVGVMASAVRRYLGK